MFKKSDPVRALGIQVLYLKFQLLMATFEKSFVIWNSNVNINTIILKLP